MATSYQDDYMKTALRLPRDLHARIQEAATAGGRSLNSELIARLEKSFEADDAPLLARAIARLEMSLAGEEAQRHMREVQLASLGRWVVDVLEGKSVGDDLQQAELLRNAKTFAAAMDDAMNGAEGKIAQFKVAVQGFPPRSPEAVAAVLDKIAGRAAPSKTGSAVNGGSASQEQAPAKRKIVRKRIEK